jgi:hypothetical protein
MASHAQTGDSLAVAMPDSLYKKQLHELDSVQQSTKLEFSKLKNEYDSIGRQFENPLAKLQHQADSARNLNLPTNQYTKKIDSLTQLRDGHLAGVKNKADILKQKSTQKINSLKLPPEISKEANGFTQGLNKLDVSLPQSDLNFPTMPSLAGKIPGISAPGVNTPALPGVSTPGVDTSLPNVGGVKTPGVLNDAKQLSDQTKEITDKTKEVTDKVVTPPSKEEIAKEATKEAESRVKDSAPVKDVTEKLELPGDNPLKDGQVSQDELKEQVKKQAVNHFAGKEQQVQKAMDEMSKLKQKYSSVQSIKDLPKKAPNPMKEKPFIERIVPGIAFQILLKNEWLTDFNPYVGYKFNGRITAGFGWNQRFAFTTKDGFNSDARIYGPRIYGEFLLFKGFSARAEFETMYTLVPPVLKQSSTKEYSREWVTGIFLGIKKDYKIYKRLKGTAFVYYNVYNPEFKSPYGDRLVTRFGLEYQFKKKSKEKKKSGS